MLCSMGLFNLTDIDVRLSIACTARLGRTPSAVTTPEQGT